MGIMDQVLGPAAAEQASAGTLAGAEWGGVVWERQHAVESSEATAGCEVLASGAGIAGDW
jgi:hypothetical protein